MQRFDCTKTANLFAPGQTVKAVTSARGGLDGKPVCLIVGCYLGTINLCAMWKRVLYGSPTARRGAYCIPASFICGAPAAVISNFRVTPSGVHCWKCPDEPTCVFAPEDSDRNLWITSIHLWLSFLSFGQRWDWATLALLPNVHQVRPEKPVFDFTLIDGVSLFQIQSYDASSVLYPKCAASAGGGFAS